MSENSLFGLLAIIILNIVLVFCIRFSIKNKNLTMVISGGIVFLLCLIALFNSINLKMIDDTTLLQIDATIITGALILFTITSFVGKSDHNAIPTKLFGKWNLPWTPHQVASNTIVFFGISSFFILISDYWELGRILGIITTLIGFAWLIVSAFVIGIKEKFSNTPEDIK